jgi:hypothetical protein
MAYNQLYTKPKNPEYGLYYTTILMVDGEQSVNGRDPASAEAAVRQALARSPGVDLDVALELKAGGRASPGLRGHSRSRLVDEEYARFGWPWPIRPAPGPITRPAELSP